MDTKQSTCTVSLFVDGVLQQVSACVEAAAVGLTVGNLGKTSLGSATNPAQQSEPTSSQLGNKIGWTQIPGASFVGNVTIWAGVLITGDLCPLWIPY